MSPDEQTPQKTQIELLREKIQDLNKQREQAVLEKGLAAEENKDLRENFAYDLWEQRETTITNRIHSLIREIEALTPKKFKTIKPKKPSKSVRPTIDLNNLNSITRLLKP